MQIAILGAGAIGSTFAYHLARAGHAVTVIARGARLAELERDGAIVLVSGERARVTVRGALDVETAYDLVLVTVLATQVDAVLPALRASAARAVMFMFNTFEPIDRLRDAVGAERFAFGFPGGVFALLGEGRLERRVRAGTTVGDPAWAGLFGNAGIPTVVERDMQSWLRSHAAMVVPLMSIGTVVLARGAGIGWREARRYAAAMADGFAVVRALGHPILPSALGAIGWLPAVVVAALLWLLSRTAMLRELGKLGPTEARMLIDMMSSLAAGRTAALRAIRP